MSASSAPPPRSGRIVTFYSFKGGVGRTMALANVAFLAAMNGKRVLVMDWDLEAPGLHYYFHGMQDAAGARSVRTAPGVLDLVWNWSNALHAAQSAADVDRLVEHYRMGAAFREHVRPLLSGFPVPDGGTLDHIGAGAPIIPIPGQATYAEALARFDWSAFFSQEAGGVLLNTLRDWAKSEYDYVFLDSRTGFADVAGICTMQIPDQVALCYIYNRQNIDGTAQVAAAIRAKRGKGIALRGVPMRVARENTSEEADARARGRAELTLRGGFASEDVAFDQKQLAIQQTPNVPFYETIALITSDRPRSDQLALDFLNLASQLLGEEFAMPSLDAGWVEAVRRRLQPRQATPDYVLNLQSKDPQRAREEVTQLLEGALEEQSVGDADREYFDALIAAAIHLARNAGDASESKQMLALTLDLLRDLAEVEPEKWRRPLSDCLEFYREHLPLEYDEELPLLDEANALLAVLPGDEPKLKRLTNRRRAARIQLMHLNSDAVSQIIGEVGRLGNELRRNSADGESPVELLAADMDLAIVSGDLQAHQEKFDDARRQYEKGLRVATTTEIATRNELVRLRFNLHGRLARLPPSVISLQDAANHAVQAFDWIGGANSFVEQFLDLGEVVIGAGLPTLAVAFLTKALKPGNWHPQSFVFFYGYSPAYSPRSVSHFLTFTRRMLKLLDGAGSQVTQAATLLLETLVRVLERTVRLHALGRQKEADFDKALADLVAVIEGLDGVPSGLKDHIIALSSDPQLNRLFQQNDE